MASEVAICNVALRYIRASAINALDEQSVNAEYCRDAYPELRDRLLESYEWSFATRIRPLSLLSDEEVVNFEHVYQYPNDCLKLQKIFVADDSSRGSSNSHVRVNGMLPFGQEVNTDCIEYQMLSIDQNRVIASNIDDLYARYTYYITDPNQMPDSFRNALSCLLASELSIALVGVDRGLGLQDRYYQLYEKHRREAQVIDHNQQRAEQPDSELVRVR